MMKYIDDQRKKEEKNEKNEENGKFEIRRRNDRWSERIDSFHSEEQQSIDASKRDCAFDSRSLFERNLGTIRI